MRISNKGLLVAFAFVFPFSSYAEDGSWTNRAGHALKAVPQSISGQSVTFAQGHEGKAVTCPLAVFLPSEQERLRCYLKDLTLPKGLKAAHEFSARVITRSRLLKENNTLSEKGCQEAIKKAVSAFRAQAAPFIEQKQLSQERLEYILQELVAIKEKEAPASKEVLTSTQ